MSVKASAKSVSISPRKVGVVAALVRGRKINDALIILEHTPRRSAKNLAKLIKSAKANAENNFSYQSDSLIIKSIYVTPGQRLKRFKPAARGRAMPYQKRTSHIFVEVDGHKKAKKKPASNSDVSKNSKKKLSSEKRSS